MDIFRAAFEQANTSQIILDGDGRIVAASHRFMDVAGRGRGPLTGTAAADLLRGLPPGGLTEQTEIEVDIAGSNDLTVRRALCTVTPLPGGQALVRLQSPPELAGWPYELIVDSIEEGITIRAEDGRLLAANRAARQMFGWQQNIQFIRRDGSPLPKHEHPALIALQADEPCCAVIGIQCGDTGRTHWLQVNCVPIRHPQAGRAVVSSFAEINALLETQARLAESEARFRAIFDHAFEFIGLLDTSGRLLEANETALSFVGSTTDEVLGLHFADTPWWKDSPEEQAKLREGVRIATQGGTVQFETTHYSHTGASVNVDFSLRPIPDADGTIRFLLPEGRDITHRKRTEYALLKAKQEAEAANLAKSSFLASTSHELRTPLNAVIGFSEAMMAEIFGPMNNPRYTEYVELIHSAGTHLRGLIEDILDVARIESGDAELREENVDLRATLESVAALLRGPAKEHQVDLVLDLPQDTLPQLYADPLRLRQIALNLIGNAVKFTPQGGQVRVSTEICADWLRLVVSDTGIGIAPEHMERIWAPFFQADASLSRRYDGTGLGLPIVRHYVEAHGGRIEACSTYGQGSCFTVSLPADRLRRAANDAADGDAQTAPHLTAAGR